MLRLTRWAVRARKQRAVRLIEEGLRVADIAAKLRVRPDTVRRWLRGKRPATTITQPPPSREQRASASPEQGAAAAQTRKREARQTGESIAAMFRAEAPEIARVLLEMAKGGDVRAATLVMKILGDEMSSAEDRNERDPEAYQRELARELQSLPPTIGAEIVALLAKAEAEAQAGPGGDGDAVDRAGRRPVRLPWQANSDASDEGRDTV